MPIRTIRYPFDIPYGYYEVQHNGENDGDVVDMLPLYAAEAVAAEQALIEAGGGIRQRHPNPVANEAMQRGATPAPQYPTPQMDQAEPCQLCGQPGKWETTKTNKRVLKCAGQCKDEVNGRFYAHTIRWA